MSINLLSQEHQKNSISIVDYLFWLVSNYIYQKAYRFQFKYVFNSVLIQQIQEQDSSSWSNMWRLQKEQKHVREVTTNLDIRIIILKKLLESSPAVRDHPGDASTSWDCFDDTTSYRKNCYKSYMINTWYRFQEPMQKPWKRLLMVI